MKTQGLRMKLKIAGIPYNPGKPTYHYFGYLIRGKVKIGQIVTVGYLGKVHKGVIVRAKQYSLTGVSFDSPAVVLLSFKGNRIRGPISKGLKFHQDIVAFSNSKN